MTSVLEVKFLSEVEDGHPNNSTPSDKHIYCAHSNLKYLIIKITEDQFAVSITPKSPPSCVQDITLAANIRQKEICCYSHRHSSCYHWGKIDMSKLALSVCSVVKTYCVGTLQTLDPGT